jgi:putative ABC transport system permease protein
MDALWQDLRFGVRMLLRSPLTAGLALLTLALGIGANTAIFSVVDGVLRQPLPLPHPERLIRVIDSNPTHGLPRFGSSALNFRDWREQSHSFESLAAFRSDTYNLSAAGTPETLVGGDVTWDFFRVLGVRPALGRFFRPEEDRPGAARVAVLSQALWRSRFGGERGVLGRRVLLDGLAHTVIGVAPPAAAAVFPQVAVWVPQAADYQQWRSSRHLQVVGRLRAGTSLARAQAEMSAIAARLERQYPADNLGWGVLLQPLHEVMVERIRPALALLRLAVWAVLLIACANVASLLLARLASREREIAMRSALGAGRGRLARQIVVESVVLFAAGGALGLVLAAWATPALVALYAGAIPRAEAIGVDGRVLAFSLIVTLAAGLLVGQVPAFGLLLGSDRHRALKEGGLAMAGSRRGRRLRSVLVLAEVALALTLLVGAGLLLRSFARLQAVDPGFAPRGLLGVALSLPEATYGGNALPRRVAFQRQALARVRSLPGVTAAATVYPLPFSGRDYLDSFLVEGRPRPSPADLPAVAVSAVSPGYFQALRIPLLRGREFGEQDDAAGPPAAVVSRAIAGRFWPGEDPVGRRISFDLKAPAGGVRWWTVVGVVGDVRSQSLGLEPEANIYRCQLQWPRWDLWLVARTAGDPGSLAAPVRRALQAVDPDLPLDRIHTLPELVDRSLAERRVRTLLLSLFGGLALILAAVGIYGLISDSVTQRTHEIGIRVALGAGRAQVLGLVLRQGMGLVGAGLAAGLAGSWLAARLLADQLFEVSAGDPLTFAAMVLVLAAVALAAHWVPAQRATEVAPLEALRTE